MQNLEEAQGLELRDVSKRFGSVLAVDSLSFSVRRGEFVSLLGPSGCGKTTILRMVAGFEAADAGSLHLTDVDLSTLPPHKRDIGMVFQDYALFPHMTVFHNVAFGLKMRNVDKPSIAEKVHRALELVQLSGYDKRKPRELSGGQQQRIALARALAIEPHLLLLDEPLSNLDARLRVDMRRELRQIQERTGISTLFVTHDQEEALSMSDHVVILNHGRKAQEGTPVEVYEDPSDPFVASFLGQDSTFSGVVVDTEDGQVRIATEDGLTLWAGQARDHDRGDRITAIIKRERLSLAARDDAPSGTNAIPALVEYVDYLGGRLEVLCRTESGRSLLVSTNNDPHNWPPGVGSEVVVCAAPESIVVVGGEGKEAGN